MPRIINFAQAINEAFVQAMEIDKNVICYGLGVDDPKGVFGTTIGLQTKYGKERVFDIPASENAMTGIAIGASMAGIRPVMTHQRLDFSLLSLDQIINNAAKFHYMFGGQHKIPITIRMIVGRGWGQGPTHSQNLQALFAHIPGLKVVMPTTPYDAKGLLLSSIFDDNPVIFIEHRWLHNMEGDVPENDYRIEIGKSSQINEGNDITIVSMSYMTVEAIHAVEILKDHDINCDLIDLRSVKPIDWSSIHKSIKKTGRLLVLDTGVTEGSIAGEIIANVCENCWNDLKEQPHRICLPGTPTPTSYSLTKAYYKRSETIINTVSKMMNKDLDGYVLVDRKDLPHDVPGDWFKGPF
ncbi:MAG: alpha-ketoacid dehydrogenase subunit beta [Candidatus Marinimicrobia bacterium]|jgi:pyruvate dehydrogenase E1 component beta subunit|nr:alpha-ketoacid dehydrogenase subunit beta [Candidatus Neomarinimicrobiota bacterium]MBT3633460.1 alpha-ketoacid dehydrogenase subunit beta [Candidatus Neomarinimicrobiota bacterium]MBT3681603.1 alpha-ketoacid dehydrogenase subunit beta [Candidatus Neomarinimicrobiota bacterium]MBT3758430.1 alpha-ketoacid dehydrogenase subunit beta [Candidatus Neomarinimicrobiota bacterium]MBT3894916.1 alpha-ketoacid dehydrogenase subunit beta [Candidatus Neomarinimicrobiota bacterium]